MSFTAQPTPSPVSNFSGPSDEQQQQQQQQLTSSPMPMAQRSKFSSETLGRHVVMGALGAACVAFFCRVCVFAARRRVHDVQLRNELTLQSIPRVFQAAASFLLPLFLCCCIEIAGNSSGEARGMLWSATDDDRKKCRHGKEGERHQWQPPEERPWGWVLPQNNETAPEASCHVRRSSFTSDKYLPDEVEKTLVVETPMVGIELDTFMKLGHIPISTTAKAKGLLTTFNPEKHVAFFISHTWWMRPMHATGYDQGAPDYVEDNHPKQHLKYKIICRAIMQLIMSGQLDLEGKTIFLWFGMPFPPLLPDSNRMSTDQRPSLSFRLVLYRPGRPRRQGPGRPLADCVRDHVLGHADPDRGGLASKLFVRYTKGPAVVRHTRLDSSRMYASAAPHLFARRA